MTALAGGKHGDIGASYDPNTLGERYHWYSSTGWVMWNIQVGGLLSDRTAPEHESNLFVTVEPERVVGHQFVSG